MKFANKSKDEVFGLLDDDKPKIDLISEHRLSNKELHQELCMLTGVVHRDSAYLFYLLMKDGSIFKKEEPVQEPVDTRTLQETTEDWFNSL